MDELNNASTVTGLINYLGDGQERNPNIYAAISAAQKVRQNPLVVVVWKDGTSRTVKAESAWEYEADADYLTTIKLGRFDRVTRDPIRTRSE